jgi:hypothetical protein
MICKNTRAKYIALGTRCVVISSRFVLYHGNPLSLPVLQRPFVVSIIGSGVIVNETNNSDATGDREFG